MKGNEKSSLLGKVMRVGERLVEMGGEAKRLAKRSRYAAEDLMEDAAHRVKRDPLRSVTLGFAVGLGMGALGVWRAPLRFARHR
jgi:ElaB/YqjD/DUF883 family membrane-anchored ribosome-binding protein